MKWLAASLLLLVGGLARAQSTTPIFNGTIVTTSGYQGVSPITYGSASMSYTVGTVTGGGSIVFTLCDVNPLSPLVCITSVSSPSISSSAGPAVVVLYPAPTGAVKVSWTVTGTFSATVSLAVTGIIVVDAGGGGPSTGCYFDGGVMYCGAPVLVDGGLDIQVGTSIGLDPSANFQLLEFANRMLFGPSGNPSTVDANGNMDVDGGIKSTAFQFYDPSNGFAYFGGFDPFGSLDLDGGTIYSSSWGWIGALDGGYPSNGLYLSSAWNPFDDGGPEGPLFQFSPFNPITGLGVVRDGGYFWTLTNGNWLPGPYCEFPECTGGANNVVQTISLPDNTLTEDGGIVAKSVTSSGPVNAPFVGVGWLDAGAGIVVGTMTAGNLCLDAVCNASWPITAPANPLNIGTLGTTTKGQATLNLNSSDGVLPFIVSNVLDDGGVNTITGGADNGSGVPTWVYNDLNENAHLMLKLESNGTTVSSMDNNGDWEISGSVTAPKVVTQGLVVDGGPVYLVAPVVIDGGLIVVYSTTQEGELDLGVPGQLGNTVSPAITWNSSDSHDAGQASCVATGGHATMSCAAGAGGAWNFNSQVNVNNPIYTPNVITGELCFTADAGCMVAPASGGIALAPTGYDGGAAPGPIMMTMGWITVASPGVITTNYGYIYNYLPSCSCSMPSSDVGGQEECYPLNTSQLRFYSGVSASTYYVSWMCFGN